MALKGFGLTRLFQQDPPPGDYAAKFVRPRPEPDTVVLVVDDSKTVHATLRRSLERQGYTVISAYDAASGVAMARQHRPAAILMDIVMPGENGFRATRTIRRDADPIVAETPVILMSGNAQATEQFWSIKIGANDFLPKPFEDDDLYDCLELALHLGEPTGDLAPLPAT